MGYVELRPARGNAPGACRFGVRERRLTCRASYASGALKMRQHDTACKLALHSIVRKQ
jgi:hypothetical protein